QMYAGDGRLKMARSLERVWPHVVETHRRFQRPQHVIRYAWKHFDTPLRLKPGVDLASMPRVDEYGMELRETRPVRSGRIRALLVEKGSSGPSSGADRGERGDDAEGSEGERDQAS